MFNRFSFARIAVLAAFAGALLSFTPSAARAASTTFAFAAADSAEQDYIYESAEYSGTVTFILYGGTSNVGLTLGAAKTIHVGYGDVETDANISFNHDNEPLPHTLSLTGTGATVTQTLPQTDDLNNSNDAGDPAVDIYAGPTVTFDMGLQGRVDVTPQEYQYVNDYSGAAAPKFAYTLLLRSPAVPVSGLTITPSSVTYPASTTGTVTLSKPAVDAENVILTSSNPAVASAPATLAFAAGQQTATFPIATYRVDTDTAVTISAGAGGTTKSAGMTVKTRPETAFTYSFADIPQIDYMSSPPESDVYFGLTGGSGTVKLAQNIPYIITAGQYFYNFSTSDSFGGQTVGPLTLSRGCTINGADQSFSQTLNMSYDEDDDVGELYFSASMGDSQTLLYDFGMQGRIEVTATGFSYGYNGSSDPTFVSAMPAQYTFEFLPPASSNTYYVSPSGSDSSPGTQAAPFLTIGYAIGAATSGDTLILEDGTYSGTGNNNLDFAGKNLLLTSVNGASKTIIDGSGSYLAFTFHSGETTATLNGLTLQNGLSNDGGAIVIDGSNTHVTVTNCTLTGCQSYIGGAIYNEGTVTISGCQFTGNTAEEGGGVYSTGTATITSCTFTGNTAQDYGGAVLSGGAATLTDCALVGNTAQDAGGGIYSGGDLTLQFCTFTANAVPGAKQSYSQAAAVEDVSDTTTATDCIFYGDTAPGNTEIDLGGDVSHCDVQGGYDGTGNLNVDPKFVRNANTAATPPDYGDRHLQSTSPCIGKGVALPAVTTDRDGKTRANPPCIGAYEYIAPPVLSSLSPSSATAGGAAFTLTVSGTGFTSASLVKWNSTTLTTTVVSSTKLTASVPASLIASAGTSSVSVTTPKVGTSGVKTFTITASKVTVASVSVSPTSVQGGTSSTGTVTLSGAAPAGGLAITQTSSSTSSATLAPTLNIAAGATSAKFKISTYAVSSTKSVTITSSVNGSIKTATLTVTH